MKIIEKIRVHFPTMEKLLEQNGVTGFDFEERYMYFYGLGTWIRNYLLREGDELYHEFVRYGVVNRDDQSYIVLLLFYLYTQEKNKKF